MKTIERIGIDLAESGMPLAEAVTDDSGRILIPAGAVLTESMLNSLQRRGVAELVVERPVVMDQAARQAMRARVEQRLSRLFRLAGDGAETRILYQAVSDFRMENEA